MACLPDRVCLGVLQGEERFRGNMRWPPPPSSSLWEKMELYYTTVHSAGDGANFEVESRMFPRRKVLVRNKNNKLKSVHQLGKSNAILSLIYEADDY